MPPRPRRPRAPKPPLEAPYPLHATTFTLHRLSPLHTLPFTSPSLQHHSKTFRDLLAGDTLRGVRIGLGDEGEAGLSKVGALRGVSWKLLGTREEWENGQGEGEDSEINSSDAGGDKELYLEGNGRGVVISITYERAEYIAILLRHSPEDLSIIGSPDLGRAARRDAPGFQSYPVLATRMPGALRGTLIQYLADSFDTHASPLTFSTDFLVGTLDTFLDRIFRSGGGGGVVGEGNAVRITKDVLITLSFSPLPPPDGAGAEGKAEEDGDLRSIDITIARDDVSQFLTRGRKALQAFTRTGASPTGGVFWTSLALYAKSHMALNINHPSVRVSKVACGAFVLGREGRMKVFAPGSLGGEDANVVEAAEESWAECVEGVVEGVVGAAEGGVLG